MHRLGVERRRRGTVGREARGGREICSLRRVRDDAYEYAPLYAAPRFGSARAASIAGPTSPPPGRYFPWRCNSFEVSEAAAFIHLWTFP